MVERLEKELLVLVLTNQGKTQKEIGAIMGIGESRVWQIKRKALARAKILERRYNCGKEN